ncbi:1,2-dihydroxy-3-keto-5-methylthiopentene dioxygenase [Streptomyces sp. NPDC050560]|uniref:1,2-dihydroxy-3-keto-5-methylthiopentene dioxygenase n=1 Tax=Streptomyces sp. NPDC050560 TaxID=3365630 RepID=UPI00379B7BEE
MTLLRTMSAGDPAGVLSRTRDTAEITARLAALGIGFTRWDTDRAVADDAGQDEILAAYRAEVTALSAAHDYRFIDVVRMRPRPEDPEWRGKAADARATFLEEHRHAEDEVRFFLTGRGCFYLHLGDHVHAVVCTAGDLLSVPAGTVHWFDMGSEPDFVAVRFFQKEDGWVGDFCAESIASRFPTLDEILAEA